MANSTTQFGGLLTNVGVAQQANSAALGLPWNISHMLIGDAGGEPSQTPDPTPKTTQTALIRQVYRAQLNALYPSPADPAVLVAELVVPPEVGGWWIRELALEDAAGNFIAVASPAPSYKPLLNQGSGRTQTIRMHVVFGNLANITLKVDPSVVLATRDYVDKAREAHAGAADPHPQYLRRADVAKDVGQLTWMGAAAGTANALVLNLKSAESAISAYAAGQKFQFKASASNTGAVTASVNGLAAVVVKRLGPAGLIDLVAGDIYSGAICTLTYDGAIFQLGVGARSFNTLAAYGITDTYTKSYLDAMHALKAGLSSPIFTGEPRTTTPQAGDNSTRIASTAFVTAAINALVAAAPGALDTLDELAAALGDDPNFATTITNLIATKVAKSDLALVGGLGGSYSRLRASASGLSSVVPVTYDALVVESAEGLCRTLKAGAFNVDTSKTGLGGIDTGVVATLTWYDVYAVWNGAALGGVFVKSGSVPVLPAGYTHSAFVGSFRTDAAKNPLRFYQVDSDVQYGVNASSNVPALPIAASGVQGSLSVPTWLSVPLADYVPPRATQVLVVLHDGSGGGGMIVAPNASYGAYSSIDNGPIASVYDGAYNSGQARMVFESSQTVYVASNVSTARLCIQGWSY